MWKVEGKTISMAENDFGIALPVSISGVELNQNDSIKIQIKAEINGAVLIEKNYSNIVNNTVELMLTESESALLGVGFYFYVVDWYQDGEFMCNILPQAVLKVDDKA